MNDSVISGGDDYLKIGSAIRKLRMQAGLSQIKLAEGICDRTALIHLEKGRVKQPSIYLLNQLCRRLSITLDDFFLFAYGGEINQLWLKKNEIDALMKVRKYEKAYELAKKYTDRILHPVDAQYLGLVEANYLYDLGKYEVAKEKYLKALAITSSYIDDEVFTLTEMRIINGLIYCNWRIDGKLSTTESLYYIKVLNNSIYDYPMDKDYRIIISLMVSTIHFYFTLKNYDDCVTIINNAIELSHRYCCYDYLGNLWVMLANIYEILEEVEKSKYFYKKATTFFNLFEETIMESEIIKHQLDIYQNVDC